MPDDKRPPHRIPVAGRRGSWTQTLDGERFFPLDPRPEDFAGRQFMIAEQLAKKPRYSGATPNVFYGNAEHCYLVSIWAQHLALKTHESRAFALIVAKVGLLHDASDGPLTDLPTPIKHDIEAIRDAWIPIEHAVSRAIFDAFGLRKASENPLVRALVKQADREVANAETRLLANPELAGFPEHATADVTPRGLEWRPARDLWLERFYDLFGDRTAPPRV